MRRTPQVFIVAAVAVPALLSLGCESSRSTMPEPAANARAVSVSPSFDRDGNRTRAVTLRDDCDPATFNAALGANSCLRKDSGMPFNTFVAVLTQNQSVGAWKIDPDRVEADPGTVLMATNRGGETHTFTRVAKFGGGFVQLLNNLSGNTTQAPECSNPRALTLLAPGGSTQATVGNDGTELYQCCIHPWMRMEVHQHAN
jgi:plastocyanin